MGFFIEILQNGGAGLTEGTGTEGTETESTAQGGLGTLTPRQISAQRE